MCDLNHISEKIRTSGISRVELSQEEVEMVVSTLVYDGRLEQVQHSVMLITGYGTHQKLYKCSRTIRTENYLTASPCGVCPVIAQCTDGGIVSPATCVYLTKWMDADDVDSSGDGVEEIEQRGGSSQLKVEKTFLHPPVRQHVSSLDW